MPRRDHRCPARLWLGDPRRPASARGGRRGRGRSVTPEIVDRFRQEMRRNGVRGAVERVPGVGHGFAMADLPVYDRDAAERRFEQTLELWRRNLSPQPAAQ